MLLLYLHLPPRLHLKNPQNSQTTTTSTSSLSSLSPTALFSPLPSSLSVSLLPLFNACRWFNPTSLNEE